MLIKHRRNPHTPLRAALIRAPLTAKSPFHRKVVECLGIGALAAIARHEGLADPVLIDGELSDISVPALIAQLEELDPDLIGLTVPLQHLPAEIIELVAGLRDRSFDGWIVIGGHSPTFYAQAALARLPGLDAVFLGEADRSFPAMIRGLTAGTPFADVNGIAFRTEGGIVTKPAAPRTGGLAGMPAPARDLTGQIIARNGLAALWTSRGCSRHCSFCSIRSFYRASGQRRGWTARPAGDVINEMTALAKTHGVSRLLVVDEDFFGCGLGIRRAREMAELLHRNPLGIEFAVSCRTDEVDYELMRLMYGAGLRHLYLGVESGSEADLTAFRKAVKVETNMQAVQLAEQAGLSVQVGTIVLHPLATIDSLRATYRMLRSLKQHGLYCMTTQWIPYHGTGYTNLFRQRGVVTEAETMLSVHYPEPWQVYLQRFFDEVHQRFLLFYELLAHINNTQTFRWRDPVKGRGPTAELAVRGFEDSLNNVLADLLEAALDEIERAARDRLGWDAFHTRILPAVEAAYEAVSLSALAVFTILQREQDPLAINR